MILIIQPVIAALYKDTTTAIPIQLNMPYTRMIRAVVIARYALCDRSMSPLLLQQNPFDTFIRSKEEEPAYANPHHPRLHAGEEHPHPTLCVEVPQALYHPNLTPAALHINQQTNYNTSLVYIRKFC